MPKPKKPLGFLRLQFQVMMCESLASKPSPAATIYIPRHQWYEKSVRLRLFHGVYNTPQKDKDHCGRQFFDKKKASYFAPRFSSSNILEASLYIQ